MGTHTGRRTIAAAVAAAGWWAWRHARAPMVAGWSAPQGERRRAGGLAVRTLGRGNEATVLLHGLTATGDAFGRAFVAVAEGRQLVVPDLYGFGGSMDMGASDFGLDPQLDALDAMAEELGIDGARRTIGGHSMGGVLALHWAARHAPLVDRVVTWGAPLHTDRDSALAAIAKLGWLERLFVLETPAARAICRWMCDHRGIAEWVAVALNPDTPVPLARQGVLHTWESYRDALDELILAQDWRTTVAALVTADVPVVLTHGQRDRIVDPTLVAGLARRHVNVERAILPRAGHELPISEPAWCAAQLLPVERTSDQSAQQ